MSTSQATGVFERYSSTRPRLRCRIKQAGWCYLFLAPTLIMYTAFTLWPIVATWYFSLFDWDGIGWPSNFVGLRNFLEVAKDRYFWQAFRQTMKFVVFQSALKLPVALCLALFLNNPKLLGRNFYRTVYFLPVVTTTAVIGIVMKFIFNPFNGPFNAALTRLGLLRVPVDWLGSIETALWVIIVVEAWHVCGQYMVYWLAGLQTVPSDLMEAAMIDGATKLQAFWYVTLPLLRPIATIIVLLGLVNALHVFDIVLTMTGGGPAFSTEVVNTFIYKTAFAGYPRIGYASAAGIFFGVTVMVISIVQGLLLRRAQQLRRDYRMD